MKKTLLALAMLLSINLQAQSLEDTVALKAFMDGVIQTHLRDKNIAGATLSVVRNGKVILRRGYGFRDEQKQLPVSADSTLFRIGSISKMFTWISVMQLVAQGKLDLNADVNQYLKDYKIPATYPEPITLKHLMTHTPGFEDLVIGLFAGDSSALKPLSEILSKEMPARVRAPGTFSSYSNHGTGIAANIVEQVSGMSFNEYVEKNILMPLGMTRTTFRQPLPPRFKPLMSEGYTFEGGLFKKHDFEYVPLYPVGAASSNANDMAKFMLAILGNGKLGAATILDSATLALMESPAHRHHPSVNPMRYGFMDVSQNGYQVIGHGGDTFWFHSLMALIPEARTGFFVSFNSEAGGGVSLQLLDQFMNQYFPEKEALRSPIAVDRKFLSSFVGEYRGNRYPHFDITKISSLFGDAKVTVEDSTRLRLTMGENVKRLVPIDSLTFREENGSKVIAFSKDEKGRIAHMYLGQIPILAFDRVESPMSMGFQSLLFVFTLVCTLLALSFWPMLALSRRHYHPDNFYKQISFPAKLTAWFNYLLVIFFFLGLALSIGSAEDIVFGIGGGVKAALTIPFFIILLTLLMAVFAAQMFASGQQKLRSKLYYLILTVGSIAFLWQLNYWNFIGYNF